MLLVDSKLFKQVAEKFANEIIEKYCPDTKVKHSFALEALSHAFGYKDYNTIKPKLDLEKPAFTSIGSLVESGYVDAEQLPSSVGSLTHTAQRELFRHLFLQLAYFYKNLAYHSAQKYYYSISVKEFPEYAKIIRAVSVCVGADFKYFEIDTRAVVYWQFSGFVFNVGVTKSSLDKGACMQIYNKGQEATECVVQGLSEKGITVRLFDSVDGHLSDNEKSFLEDEKLFLTYNSDKEMRMAAMLVNDITNKGLEYSVFLSSFDGMVRARYVVENHPDVAMYILCEIYGHNPEFI